MNRRFLLWNYHPHGAAVMPHDSPRWPVDVLIADHCGLFRGQLCTLLEQQGFTCAEARDGGEALELASLYTPPCLLLDLDIAVVDFFTVAQRLRESPRTRGIGIHCLSGRSDDAARAEAARAGCASFLTRSVEPELLLDLVRSQAARAEPTCVTGLTQDQARDLLDWLENNGYPPATVALDGKAAFTVRYSPWRRSR
jgi:CheY-like chemotaxis protein